MPVTLSANSYGKNAVNLSRIIRNRDLHEFMQVSVNVILEGDFNTAHTIGDNSKILPTDTQKNTVYALAREHLTGAIETFGIALARHFLERNTQISGVVIEIKEQNWARISTQTGEHPHAFINGGIEKRTTHVSMTHSDTRIISGISDLLILKSADSAFRGYLRDNFTTLKETDDRILSTQCEIQWEYVSSDLPFQALYDGIRETLLAIFAGHQSLSIQHTLYAMGEGVLHQFDAVREISFKMPNKHHIPFNLEPLGMENQNDIFVATDEPFGYITGTVVRS